MSFRKCKSNLACSGPEQDMCSAYLQGILIWTWQPGAYCEDSYNKSPTFLSSQRCNCSPQIIWLRCGLPSISNTESISNSWQMSFLALHSFLTLFSVSLAGNTELIGKIRKGLLQLLQEKVGADRMQLRENNSFNVLFLVLNFKC